MAGCWLRSVWSFYMPGSGNWPLWMVDYGRPWRRGKLRDCICPSCLWIYGFQMHQEPNRPEYHLTFPLCFSRFAWSWLSQNLRISLFNLESWCFLAWYHHDRPSLHACVQDHQAFKQRNDVRLFLTFYQFIRNARISFSQWTPSRPSYVHV